MMLEFEYKYRGIIVIPRDQLIFIYRAFFKRFIVSICGFYVMCYE